MRIIGLIISSLFLAILTFYISCGCGSSSSSPSPTYTIGGAISGLTGTVVLQNNAGDDLTVLEDGAFAFATEAAEGSEYLVTVKTNPNTQTCTASDNAGTVSGANVTNISVVCSTNTYTVGGTITDLTGTIILQNNSTDDLSLVGEEEFTFATAVADGSGYEVAILTQPTIGQTCTVSDSSGTVSGANVTNVSITCSPPDCDGTPKGVFQSGSGSASDPYVICTEEQLNSIGDNYNGRSFKLAADLDMTTGFTMIAGEDQEFTGTFDGNGFTISNITIDEPSEDYVGFVRYTEGGTLTNLKLENVEITGKDYVGGLVGFKAYGSIVDSYVTGSVIGTSTVGGLSGYYKQVSVSNSHTTCSVVGADRVGGLLGHKWNGVISDSYATGSVSGVNKVGGLVGDDYGGTISNSHAIGDVESTGDYVGGLVGYHFWVGSIENSYATGAVIGGSNLDGDSYAGGLVGDGQGSIENSYATGSVNGDGNYVGGLAGRALDSITKSYAIGDVDGDGDYVGGLAGYGGDSITNSYATGGVESTGDYVGGLVGHHSWAKSIENSYSAGKVTGVGAHVGGLVGDTDDTDNCTKSFWDTQVSTQATTACGATGKTTAQMKAGATFTNWDFDNIWDIDEGISYPFLQ